MTRYASFASGITDGPAPVTGWYDTEEFHYPNLPPAADLLEMTDAQWDARLTGFWAVDGGSLVTYNPPAPQPTADQVLAGKIALGIAITSPSNTSLDCTMGLDSVTMDQIGAVARDAAAGLGLPGGLDTFTYPDIDGTPRTFNQAQTIQLYKDQRDLLLKMNQAAAQMRQGLIPNWPLQTGTIP